MMCVFQCVYVWGGGVRVYVCVCGVNAPACSRLLEGVTLDSGPPLLGPLPWLSSTEEEK